MRIRDAINKIQDYWKNCPSNNLAEEAKKDFSAQLRELSSKGYTWGYKHQLPWDPVKVRFEKNDYKIMLNVLYRKQQRRRSEYQNKNRN